MSQQIIFRAKCIFLKWTETIFHFISFLLLPFIFLYLLLLHNYFLPSLFLFCLSPSTSPTLFYFSLLLLSYPLPPSPLHYKFSSPWLFTVFFHPTVGIPSQNWELGTCLGIEILGLGGWCDARLDSADSISRQNMKAHCFHWCLFVIFFLQLLHHLYLLLTWYTEVAGSCTKLSMWPNCRTASYVCLALS